MLTPKETGEYISNLSKSVLIEEEGVESLSLKLYDELKNGSISVSNFLKCDVHPVGMLEEKAINWIFVVDTLNFCFWAAKRNSWWEITHEGNKYSGYFGLCAAINKAIKGGIDMTDPKVYSQLELKDLEEILQGDDSSVKLQLMKERLDSLHQVGNVLLEKYEGSFVNCIKNSKNSAQSLLNTVVSEFSCFRDESIYKGKKVSFYKRAQILVSDIWGFCQGKGLGEFHDIDTITMFADYRVPQVLVHFGVLKYSPELHKLLKSEVLLESGCEEELEIRGCSIEAVERVKNRVLQLLEKSKSESNNILCNSILIDNYLWEYRRHKNYELEHIPYHKVVSIYY
ncbi:queuosine 5'-phosphate N-glycosylase/hydrolase-like isoform X1 [Lycorma delicatula]|uniref:queuosine 5'-phosphate N-glycosylase/hydrolase-like isoform X1 n=2 Tax=Lycorma delicatula TaxID=130591 RepID=UPI003F510E80